MLSVAIMINGNPIMARSAVNRNIKFDDGNVEYQCDDGTIIHHNPDDGAVKLAIKLLKTIKEQK